MTIKKTITALVLTFAITTLMAALGSPLKAKPGESSAPELEGSWEITVLPNGGDPITNIATFTGNGGVINTDPDPNLSTGHGTWVKTGPQQYAVTFVHFLSNQGVPLGTLKVRAVMQLDNSTDTFSGPFRTDVYIGGNLVQSVCGTVQAKRMSVEALEVCP